MKLRNIKNSDSLEFKICFDIYEKSFPSFERRLLKNQIDCINNSNYNFDSIIDSDKNVVGFISYWENDKFLYIEHFAIDESQRGKNVGTIILSLIKEKTNLPIILEIDPPIDNISIKREKFYNKLDFTLSKYDYIHPGYKKESEPHILKLMCDKEIDENLFNDFYDYLTNFVMKYTEK